MALSDEGISVNEAEIKYEFGRVNARLAELERQMLALNAYVRGSDEVGATGLAKQVHEIAQNVTALLKRAEEQDTANAHQRKLFGLLGVKDLPSAISIVLSLMTLAKLLALW